MPTAQPVRFTDACKTRFSGSASQDFVNWLDDFEIAADLQEGLSNRQRVNLLLLMMEGNCRRVVKEFIRSYQERRAEPPSGDTPSQNRARDDYWRMLYDQLVEHLKSHSTIAGTDPGTRLMTQWRDLAQRPDEGVRAYSHRVDELVERLAAQEPPIPIAPRDVFVTFVNGLSEPTRIHVESQCAKTKDKALELAEAHESAHRPRPGATAPSTNAPHQTTPEPAPQPAAPTASVSANDYRTYMRPTYGATQQANSVGTADQPHAENLATATCMATTLAAITPDYGPGSMNQICLTFLRNRTCRFGDHCFRLHVYSLDQNQDARPNVKTRVTEEAKSQARGLIDKYPDGPPRAGNGDRNVRPRLEPVHRVLTVRESRPVVGGLSNVSTLGITVPTTRRAGHDGQIRDEQAENGVVAPVASSAPASRRFGARVNATGGRVPAVRTRGLAAVTPQTARRRRGMAAFTPTPDMLQAERRRLGLAELPSGATTVGLELPAIFWMTASLAREPRWVKCFFLLLYGLRVEAAAEAARQQRQRQSQPAPDHADSSDAPTGESEDEMVMMVTQARTKARHTKARPRPKLSPVRMSERITNLNIDGERWDTEIKAHDIAGQPDKLRLSCTERRVCKPGEDEEYMTWSVTTSRARAEEPGGVLKAFAAALDQAGVRRTDPNAFNFVDSGHSGKDAGVLAPPSSPRRPSADTAITRGLSMPSEPKRLFADSVDEFEAFWDDEIKYPFLD